MTFDPEAEGAARWSIVNIYDVVEATLEVVGSENTELRSHWRDKEGRVLTEDAGTLRILDFDGAIQGRCTLDWYVTLASPPYPAGTRQPGSDDPKLSFDSLALEIDVQMNTAHPARLPI